MNRGHDANRCLLRELREQTLRTPRATAVQSEGGLLTYLDLDRASDVLAQELRRGGCGPDVPVALRLTRSSEMVVAILATLKAGGAYLPIATDSPRETASFILAEAKPVRMIERDADSLPPLEGKDVPPVIRIDIGALRAQFATGLDPVPEIAADTLAYILYTSGSTGRPKGCMIEHGALRNRIWWMHRTYPIDATSAVLQKTPYTFDVSVWEFVWPLAVGARLVLARPEGHRDPTYLRVLMDDQRVSVCHFVPSMLRYFLHGLRRTDCSSLRHVFLSGEALPYDLMCEAMAALPNASFHNLYGPTEAAIDVSFFDCAPREDEIVPIGRAIDGIDLFIADPDGRPLPQGRRGELLIAGAGLARGYLDRPKLTEEKFPTLAIDGLERRVYRTGDFAELLPDGLIRFHGRMDGQIKLRGQRIELGEVEAALRRLPQVDEAVVLLDETDSLDHRLVACCTGRLDGVTLADIRRDVGDYLAEHCKPNALIALEAMPTTGHGKIDRQALAGLLRGIPASAREPAPESVPEPAPAARTEGNGDGDSADRAAKLLVLCRETLDVPDLEPDQDFFDLGATSFTLLQLGERIDATFGVDIPVEAFLADPSVHGLLPHVGAADTVPVLTDAVAAPETDAGRGGASEPNDSGSDPDRVTALLALCRETLDVPDLEPDQDFFDLGATSFTLLQLGERIDATFGVDIPVEAFLADPSVRGLLPHVDGGRERPTAVRDVASIAPTPPPVGVMLPSGAPLHGPAYRPVDTSADVPSSALLRMLSPLAPLRVGGDPKFLHASGGGKYPLRVVLTVFRDERNGPDPGRYLIESGTLHPLRDGVTRKDRAPRLDVFADLTDLTETYRTISGLLATLDLGYLAATLLEAAGEAGLAICPATPPVRAGDLPDHYLPLAGFDVGLAMPGEAADHPSDPSELYLDAFRQINRSSRAHAESPEIGDGVLRLTSPAEIDHLRRRSRRTSLRSPLASAELTRITGILDGVPDTDLLLHVKPWGVEGLAEGLYRVMPDGVRFEALSLGPVPSLRQGFYPFNRAHFDGAGLTILVLGERRAKESPAALHRLGRIGQTLLQNQPELGAAICPIGWIDLAFLTREIPGLDGKTFLHGFIAGAWDFPELATAAGEASGDRAVALIGMSARFGECRGEDSLWSLFDRGDTAIRALPAGRRAHWIGEGSDDVPTYGAWFDRIDMFDAARFGIAPLEARTMDPQERLVLEEVHLAIENAGYVPRHFARQVGRVGVFVGAMWQDYSIVASDADMEEGEILGSAALSSIANHVSHHFDFDGPSLAIDTGCCSALSALDQARRAILDGRCVAAVIAGVSLCAHPYHRRLLMRSDLLTSGSRPAIYGSDAKGWIFGEGAGAIVLRASDDALEAGDPVRVTVAASVSRHRGRARLRTMPDSAALARIIADMFEESRLDASDVQFVEAAAGGAAIADAIEVAALGSVMEDTSAVWPIGSGKGNIGHAEAASGIAQLVKAVRQIEAGCVAPVILAEPPNRKVPFRPGSLFPAESHVRLPDGPKCGLVNGFSAEGVSAHAVLRSPSPPPSPSPTKCGDAEAMYFPVSASGGTLLRQHCDELATALSTGAAASADLASVLATLAIGREPLPVRCVLRAATRAELVAGLRRIAESAHDEDPCLGRPDLGAWRDGHRDDWPETPAVTHRRAALPARPFEATPHWIRERDAGAAPPQSVRAVPGRTVPLADWLVDAYARASEIDPNRITPDTPLDELGLNSIVVTRMAQSLAERGIGIGRESIWFSASTLRAVAEGLGGEMTPETPTVDEVAIDPAGDADRSAIAVVGLSGRWPGGEDLDEFWKLLCSGASAIGSVDPERGDWRRYLSEGKGRPGRTYTTAMGALSRPYRFDAGFFGITPREAALIDPQERLFMETAWSAVEEAGFAPNTLYEQGAVGVFVGVMNDTFERVVAEEMDAADGCAPQTNRYWSIANRVSFQLNLGGPSLAVDTACSSGLSAVHLAMQSLRSGETAMAIAGGVNLILHPGALVARSMLGMLSPDGRCRAFGAEANGTVVSEGCGAMLLAPLALARELGCHIHGILRGSAMNSGGRTNGYTMPNATAQTALVRRALADARLTPADITCIEAHGTGTDLGDPLEFDGLRDAFAVAGTEAERNVCSLGSVKVNIGHAESAAGLAALTKVMLQLRHGQYVPGVALGEASARVDTEGTPFVLQRELGPWPRPPERGGRPDSSRRRAGVSSFGAGGTNVHVIIEEPEQEAPSPSADVPRLLPVSARSGAALRRVALELANAIGSGRVPQLDALAFTLCVGRAWHPFRAFVHAGSLDEAADAFARIARGEEASGTHACGHLAKGETAIEAGDGAERVGRALRATDLGGAGHVWLRSAPFRWSDVLDFTAARIPLPTYPFEGEDYRPTSRQSPPTRRTVPLDIAQSLFEQHRVAGRPACAGVVLADLAARALGAVRGDAPALKEVTWHRLLGPADGTPTLSIVPMDDGRERFEIAANGSEICSGEIERDTAEPGSAAVERAEGMVGTGQFVDVERLYREAEEGGLRYGPIFRQLRSLALGDGRGVAVAGGTDASTSEAERRAGLLDAGLQAAAALLIGNGSVGGSLIPARMGRFVCDSTLPSASQIFVSAHAEDAAACDVLYTTLDGREVARIDGIAFHVRPVAAAVPEPAVASLVYAPVWSALDPPPDADASSGAIWVIGEDDAAAERAAAALPGRRLVPVLRGEADKPGTGPRINPDADPERLEMQIREVVDQGLAPDTLLCWADAPSASFAIEEELRAFFYPCLRIAGALAASDNLPKHFVQLVAAQECAERPLVVAMSALFDAISAEFPRSVGNVVLVPPNGDMGGATAFARAQGEAGLYRSNGASWQRRAYEPCAAPSASSSIEGLQVVTGGLGAAARSMVSDLLETTDARFLLVSRHPPGPEQRAWIAGHDDRLLHAVADCTDATAMRAALEAGRGGHGPIRGVFHAAGTNVQRRVERWTPLAASQVLAPKVFGFEVLDRLTIDDPLDHFTVFSSLAGVAPQAGQAAYGFANLAMSGLIEAREVLRESGRRRGAGRSLLLPFLTGGGMGADPAMLARLEAVTGVAALDVSSLAATVTASLGRVANVQAILPGERRVIMARMSQRHLNETTSREPVVRASTSDDVPSLEDRLVGYLRQSAAVLTGIDEGHLDPETEFSEFGMDSVLLTQWATALSDATGREILPTIFFEGFSIARLAAKLADEHGSDLETLLADGDPTPPTSENVKPEPLPSTSETAKPEPPLEENSPHSVPRPMAHRAIDLVGLACRFPGASSAEAFWKLLASGRLPTAAVPPQRWRVPGAHAGLIEDVRRFDARFFGMSPLETEQMDPQQRHLLEVSWHAFEDAGIPISALARSRVGVFVGASTHDYAELTLAAGVVEAHSSTGTGQAFLSNRLSFLFDLKGPSQTIDTACSSSLVALTRALDAIRCGRCDMALVAGVNLMLTGTLHRVFEQAGMLSPRGVCSSFSDDADGYVRSEGVGAVILRARDCTGPGGSNVYGTVLGAAENHGGRAQSLTAPNPAAQADLLRDAYADAGIDVLDVDYVETHGTGTSLGDPIEVEGLKLALGAGRMAADGAIALGALKSQIGHMEAAAGIGGLIKVALSMRRGHLPANCNFRRSNSYLRIEETPFRLQTEAGEWSQPARAGRMRRAGVSSFGIGGSNAHVVLEAPDAMSCDDALGQPYLCVVSAKTDEALRLRISDLAEFLRQGEVPTSLRDISYTLAVGRDHFSKRRAFVATDPNGLIAALEGEEVPDARHDGASASFPTDAAKVDTALLSGVAAAYVHGATIDFAANPQFADARIVSLPGYPFAGRDYWLAAADGAADERSTAPPSDPIRLAATDPLLAEHVVAGRPLLPGMVSAVVALDTVGRPVDGIHRVRWRKPIGADEDGLEVAVEVSASGEGWLGTTGEDTAVEFSMKGEGLIAREHLEAVPERTDSTDLPVASALYEALARAGMAYGPGYRLVTRFQRGPTGMDGWLQLPKRWSDHPEWARRGVLLDGALHLVAALEHDKGATAQSLHVPVSLDALAVWDSLPEKLFVRVTSVGDGKTDLDLHTLEGLHVGAIRGYRTHRLADAPERDGNVVLMGRNWVRMDPPPRTRRHWRSIAVLDTDIALANLLSSAQPDASVRRISVHATGSPDAVFDPKDEGALHAILAGWDTDGWYPDLIVHVLAKEVAGEAMEDLEAGLLLGVKSVFSCVKAAAALHRGRETRIVCAYASGADVPLFASITGLARTVRAEHPALRMSTVDQARDDPVSLRDYLLELPDAVESRLEQGTVFVPRLVRVG